MLRKMTALMLCLCAIPSMTIAAPENAPSRIAQAAPGQAPAQPRTLPARTFARGDVLPEAYRARVVKNPYHYGLTPPKRNQQWVQVGRTFYLIDRESGQINDRLDL